MPSPALHPTDQSLQAYGLGKLDDASAGFGPSTPGVVPGLPPPRRRDVLRQLPRQAPRRPGPARSTGPRGLLHRPGSRCSTAARPAPAPPPASTLPPGLADHPDYEILRELGRGGMGVVYLAENTLMGRKEVLKVVSGHLINRPGVLDRFLREIRIGRQAAPPQHRHRLLGPPAGREPRPGHGVRRGARPGADGQGQGTAAGGQRLQLHLSGGAGPPARPRATAWSTATSSPAT